MTNRARLVLALSVGLALGCTSSTPGSTPVDAGVEEEEPRTYAPISLFGQITELTYGVAPPAQPTPLADVEVCAADRSDVPCVRTDAKGEYTLSRLPAKTDVAVTYSKPGYHGAVVEFTSPPISGVMFISLGSDATIDKVARAAALDWPSPTTGVIVFRASGGGQGAPLPDVSARMTPAAGKGAVFAAAGDAGASIDPSLAKTSIEGWGLFGNVPVGHVELTFTHPARSCTRNNKGWPSTTATMRARVFANRVVYLFITC